MVREGTSSVVCLSLSRVPLDRAREKIKIIIIMKVALAPHRGTIRRTSRTAYGVLCTEDHLALVLGASMAPNLRLRVRMMQGTAAAGPPGEPLKMSPRSPEQTKTNTADPSPSEPPSLVLGRGAGGGRGSEREVMK